MAVVLPIPKQTPKKECIVVQFSTLTRSATKRQQEEMMRDVESQIDSNRKKGEAMETPCAPVKGVPVTPEHKSVPVKSAVEKQSGVPVKSTTDPKGVTVKIAVEQSGAPVTREPEGVLVSTETESVPVKSTTEPKGVPGKSAVEQQSGAPVKKMRKVRQ